MADLYIDLSHTAAEVDQSIDRISSHVNDSTSHITSAERESWNAKATSDDIASEAQARQTADTALQTDIYKNVAAISGQINGGSKNRATVNSISATLRTSIAVNLPAGEYVIYFGEINSTDTDASVCLLSLLDASSASLWSGGTTRGEGKTIAVTIAESATSFMVYASDNYNHSAGDTVTISNLMICTKADWDISQAYVPYCPTMPELYQMILAMQS